MIYIILFILFIFSSLKEIFIEKDRFSPIFFLTILLILATIRHGTGTDFNNYLELWEYIEPLNQKFTINHGGIEPGFVLIISILKIFTNSPIIYFGVCAFFALVPMYIGLKKIPVEYLLTSLFIFYLSFYIPYPFNGMRQAISMSLLVFSVPYMIEKKTFTVIVLSLIASSFHMTGFLIFISYILTTLNLNLKSFFIGGFVLSIILWRTQILSHFLFNFLGVNSVVYRDLFDSNTSLFQLLTRSILIVVILYFGHKVDDDVFKKLLIIYLTGYFIYIALFDLNMLATRFNMFFRVLEIILIPILLNNCKNKATKLALLIIFLIPCIYSFYMTIKVPDNYYKLTQFLF